MSKGVLALLMSSSAPPAIAAEAIDGRHFTISTPSGTRPSWVEEAFRQHQANAPFIASIDLGQEEPFNPPMTIAGARFCTECGCTEFDACTHPDHGNCWWVGPNLCSHCKYGWGDQNGR